MTSNEIKAAPRKESHSDVTSSLADSGGFLDDSVLTAIRQAAARLNPRQSARKPAISRQSSMNEAPAASGTSFFSEKRLVSQGPPTSEKPSVSQDSPPVSRESLSASHKSSVSEKSPAGHRSSGSHKSSAGRHAGRHAGPVRNRPHLGRQAPPKHAAA
jgi:hypothetical protein